MTVYVYRPRGQGAALFGRTSSPDPWFALTADTEDELHALAAEIGLTRAMFQPATPAGRHQGPVAGHYNLTLGERDRAVTLGAQSITARDASRMAAGQGRR